MAKKKKAKKKKAKKKARRNQVILTPLLRHRVGVSARGQLSAAISELKRGGFAAVAAQVQKARDGLQSSLTGLRPSANPGGKKYLSVEAVRSGRRPIYIGKMTTDDLGKSIKDLKKEVHGMSHRMKVISRAPDDSSAAVRVF